MKQEENGNEQDLSRTDQMFRLPENERNNNGCFNECLWITRSGYFQDDMSIGGDVSMFTFDSLYFLFGILLALLCLASLFNLGSLAILGIAIILISIVGRVVLNKKKNTILFVFIMHPFTLLGWRLLVNAMLNNSDIKGFEKFLPLFGVVFLTIGIIATLFLDCDDSFLGFFYSAVTLIIMIFARAYGEYAPYIITGVLTVVGIIIALAVSIPKGIQKINRSKIEAIESRINTLNETNRSYPIDIIPFLDFLSTEGTNIIDFNELINIQQRRKHDDQLEANMLNRAAEKLGLEVRVE